MTRTNGAPARLSGLGLPLATLAMLLALVASMGCGGASQPSSPTAQPAAGKTKLVVFEAGSLMAPFAGIEKEFERQNPDIDVEIEAHGSIQVIRQVTELGREADVVAVADYSLIPMLMYATKMPDGRPYADWYIKPATNTMVLAYSDSSKYADELNADNWYQVVSRPDVRFGLADPRLDAVGYRTLMLDTLAESYYRQDHILRDMVGNSFGIPIAAVKNDGKTTISVPEVLEPSDTHMILRGASIQLIALLQSNDIDYAFEYKSVVAQQGLKYIELPPQINLGDESFAAVYRQVVVKLDFRRFKTVEPVFQGVPIGYGLTIPGNSNHKEAAARLIEFVLGPDGKRIFAENNHPELVPPECDNVSALPDALKPLFR